jgi:hypothetical protein
MNCNNCYICSLTLGSTQLSWTTTSYPTGESDLIVDFVLFDAIVVFVTSFVFSSRRSTRPSVSAIFLITNLGTQCRFRWSCG